MVVVEGDPAVDGMFSGSGLAEGSGIEALLIQSSVGAFHLAVLLRMGYGDELVVDGVVTEGLFEGVGLLHMREEDVSELRAVVGLHLLDRERVGVHYTLQELDAGLGGELGGDPGHLETGVPTGRDRWRCRGIAEGALDGCGAS